MKRFIGVLAVMIGSCFTQVNAAEFSGLTGESTVQQPLPEVSEPVVLLSCITTTQSIITAATDNGQVIIKLNSGNGDEIMSLRKNVGEVDYDFSSAGNHYAVTLTIPNGTFTYQLYNSDTGKGIKVLRDGNWVNGADCIDSSVKSQMLENKVKTIFNH